MKPSAEKNNKSAGRWQRLSGSRLSYPAVWLFWIAVWFLLSLLVHRELLLPGPLGRKIDLFAYRQLKKKYKFC